MHSNIITLRVYRRHEREGNYLSCNMKRVRKHIFHLVMKRNWKDEFNGKLFFSIIEPKS